MHKDEILCISDSINESMPKEEKMKILVKHHIKFGHASADRLVLC